MHLLDEVIRILSRELGEGTCGAVPFRTMAGLANDGQRLAVGGIALCQNIHGESGNCDTDDKSIHAQYFLG